MCATCVTQGAPYVLGAVVALRAMGSTSRRRKGDDTRQSDPEPAPAAEPVTAEP